MPAHNSNNILDYLLADGKYAEPTSIILEDNSTDIDIHEKYDDFQHKFNDYRNRQKLDVNNIVGIAARNKAINKEDIPLYIKKEHSWYIESQFDKER
jgi:hypothetical protein